MRLLILYGVKLKVKSKKIVKGRLLVMKKMKKAVVGAIIIIFAVIITLMAIKYNSDRRRRNFTPAIERVTTELGDEFGVKVVRNNFPDLDNFISILDTKSNERIAFFVVEGEFIKPQFVTLLNTSEIRCYQYSTELIYRIADGKFESIDIEEVSEIKPEEKLSFIKVAQALIAKKEWVWIKTCGRFLFEAGDNDMKQVLERYAADKFTSEELMINEDSEIKKEDIITFSKQIIEQE